MKKKVIKKLSIEFRDITSKIERVEDELRDKQE